MSHRRPHMPHPTFVAGCKKLGLTEQELKTMTASPNERIRAWLKGEDQIPFAFFGWFRAMILPGQKEQILAAFRDAIESEGASDPFDNLPDQIV